MLPFQAEFEAYLKHQIGADAHSLRRIHDYYIPVFSWLHGILTDNTSAEAPVIGINGQQGCGKSTLCQYICELFKISGKRVISVSVDDFYLTNEQQRAIAQKYPNNPYLQPRGYPGTHDIDLAVETLTDLRNLKFGEQMLLPRYDKSAFSGQGDRYPKAQWPEVDGPVDLVLFEGWMLGYSSDPALITDDENMLQINHILENYSVWNELPDAFLHLDSDNPKNVVKWRVEAEMNMKAAGKSGMSEDETEAYAHLFLPCYEVYLPRLREKPPLTDPYLRLELSADRLPKQNWG